MSAGHTHGTAGAAHEPRLWIAFILTSTFLVAEVIGGLITGSLALLSDAAHMFTDAAAQAIALAAIRVGRRPADRRRTFGYYRFEILAAAFNAILLFGVALYILYEAWRRLQNPPEILSLGMLAIGTLGLIVNLISMRLLSAGSEASLNVKGAYLEVWSDMLGSIGVILAAIVIYLTGWSWVDSAIAAAIGLWVVPRTWTLLKESTNILLQGVPEGIELGAVDRALRAIDGVADLHDLHVWSLTSGKHVLSVHVVADLAARDEQEILAKVDRAARAFGIGHTTVQVESQQFHGQSGEASGHDTHQEEHLPQLPRAKPESSNRAAALNNRRDPS